MTPSESDDKMVAEAVDLLKKQIDVERDLIKLYGKTTKILESKAVKHLLNSIQLDSVKHIDICQTAIDILSGEEMVREEKRELRDELQRHIALEKDSIDRTKRIMRMQLVSENKGVERLMKDLFDDEKRHHKMLQKLLSRPFYRVDPNDFGFIMLGEDIIRMRQEHGVKTGVPKKKV